ncbi:protein of unknown function [Magnetospirillum sp. XM-1]|nr:protein of unknown function [Magnetospirillum sp. XM-1]
MVMLMVMSTRPTTQCFPADWRYVDGHLIEARHDGEIRIWGPWGGAFGCRTAEGTAVIPEWQPLGLLGVWFEPVGLKDEAWFASRAALAAYWSTIPACVRLKAAQAGDSQWQACLHAHHNYAPLQIKGQSADQAHS